MKVINTVIIIIKHKREITLSYSYSHVSVKNLNEFLTVKL